MVVWANHRVWEEPAGLSAAGHGCMGATSRVRREAYARFCERQGVRLPLPTRRLETGHGLGPQRLQPNAWTAPDLSATAPVLDSVTTISRVSTTGDQSQPIGSTGRRRIRRYSVCRQASDGAGAERARSGG